MRINFRLINIRMLVLFAYAIMFVSLFMVYGVNVKLLIACSMIFAFGECVTIDIEKRIIPRIYLILCLIIGICELILHYTVGISFYKSVTDVIVGLLAIPITLYIVISLFEFILKRELLGMGDIKAFSVAGFILGYQYQYIFLIFTFLIAFFITIFKAIKMKKIKVTIPLAPAMFISLFITLFIIGITIP